MKRKRSFIQFETSKGYYLWLADDVSAEQINMLINTAYALFGTTEEEREEYTDEPQALIEIASTRIAELEPEEAQHLTNRAIRMLFHHLMMEGLIFPSKRTMRDGWIWLKEECASLGMAMPKEKELIASNILLNFALGDGKDQYGLFLTLLNNAGMADSMGMGDEVAGALQTIYPEAVNG